MVQTEYHVGQVWKDSKHNPESIFVITHVYTRTYKSGDPAERVVGMVISREDYSLNQPDVVPHGTAVDRSIPGDDLRDLDARSVFSMFPYLMFQSYDPEEPEDK